MLTTKTPIRSLTEEQVSTLLKFAGLDGVPYYFLVFFLLNTGLRVGEAVHVTWRDVLTPDGVKDSLEVLAGWTKRKQARTIPLSKSLQEAILNWRKYCYSSVSYWACMDFPILPGHKRKGYSVRRIEQIISYLGGASLGIRVTPHMMRHTCATRLLKVCDIRTIQLLLGHVALSSTQVYLNPSLNDIRAAVDKL